MKFIFVALAGAMLAQQPAVAADTTHANLLPITLWKVDYAERECRLTRTFGKGKEEILFRLARGSSFDRYDIMLAGVAIPNKGGKVNITTTLEPQNASENFTGQNVPVPKRNERVLRWFDGQTDLIASGPKDQVMVVKPGFGKPIRLQLDDFRDALAAMQTCHDDLLRSWQIDPVTLASFKALPKPMGNLGVWATTNDYPRKSLDAGIGGDVAFKLRVGSDGKPIDCLVIESSKIAELDATTCRLVMLRARFSPALGPDGVAAEAPYVNRIQWRVPDS